jgi:nucleotide-binding universal stress UspA family protein
MKKVEKIVVPVDFTQSTKKLVEYAQYMAKDLHAVIDFVHVVADYPEDAMVGAPFAKDYQQSEADKASEKMAGLVEDTNEVCSGCNGEVVYGKPVDSIVEFAKSKHADMIILGTHNAKGLEKIILGNVAEHVLRKADCPVLIMNPYKDRS